MRRASEHSCYYRLTPPTHTAEGCLHSLPIFFQILCDCGYCSILIYSTLQLFNCEMLSCALFSMNPNKKNDIIISQMQKSFSVQLFTPDCCCHQYLTNFFYMNEAILRNTLTHLHTASLSLMGLFIHRGRHRPLSSSNIYLMKWMRATQWKSGHCCCLTA